MVNRAKWLESLWIHLQTAIEALRRISGTQQRIEEPHRQLLTYQEQAPTNMRRLGVELDVTDWALQAQEAVKGKPLDEACWRSMVPA